MTNYEALRRLNYLVLKLGLRAWSGAKHEAAVFVVAEGADCARSEEIAPYDGVAVAIQDRVQREAFRAMTYAQKLEHILGNPDDYDQVLSGFDVKSLLWYLNRPTVGNAAGLVVLQLESAQTDVDFVIVSYVGSPGSIALIPKLFPGDGYNIIVRGNNMNDCPLPGVHSGLAFPTEELPQALASIAAMRYTDAPYTVPVSGVTIDREKWSPSWAATTTELQTSAGAGAGKPTKRVMRIFRRGLESNASTAREKYGLSIEMVALQPRTGDFALRATDSGTNNGSDRGSNNGAKSGSHIDSHIDAKSRTLAEQQNGDVVYHAWYGLRKNAFDPTNPTHFAFMTTDTEKAAYMIPCNAYRPEWFTTERTILKREHVAQYRVDLTQPGWFDHAYEIVLRNPTPTALNTNYTALANAYKVAAQDADAVESEDDSAVVAELLKIVLSGRKPKASVHVKGAVRDRADKIERINHAAARKAYGVAIPIGGARYVYVPKIWAQDDIDLYRCMGGRLPLDSGKLKPHTWVLPFRTGTTIRILKPSPLRPQVIPGQQIIDEVFDFPHLLLVDCDLVDRNELPRSCLVIPTEHIDSKAYFKDLSRRAGSKVSSYKEYSEQMKSLGMKKTSDNSRAAYVDLGDYLPEPVHEYMARDGLGQLEVFESMMQEHMQPEGERRLSWLEHKPCFFRANHMVQWKDIQQKLVDTTVANWLAGQTMYDEDDE
ncbi:hypothetical protein LTR56_015431 [Elasticomyces elasticus]|nr:hypothetical protein LTR56_015431 [Elasticomyces elasticus]KAK3646014.1 hypothetical protein LTR22_014449 [Elasticomyces elasticus]KAK4912688.1 hypothetical protein LTR49_018861 [Elasticomyces elasticus]KAK5761804.1 hypothetical protein LTS12_008059 [Elasticomyces elasticus]